MDSRISPAVASFAKDRLIRPLAKEEAFGLTKEGHLLISVSGEVIARAEDLLLCSENVEVRPLNLRMQGREVPQVFQRLAAMEGNGYLMLSRAGETFFPLRLEKDLCFFVEQFLWAMEATLTWDVGTLLGSRSTEPVSLVRVAGEGQIGIRVPGELVSLQVTEKQPHRVHYDTFVGWVGNVIPIMDENVPFLRCEGEGTIFVCLPAGQQGGTPDAQV